MLAKELKIKTLKKQREFIRTQLSKEGKNQDGDPSYRYVGHMYSENIAYFEGEGYKVTRIECDALTAQVQGLPVYLFVVGDVELTEDELKEAEAICIGEEENDDDSPCDGLMISIFD